MTDTAQKSWGQKSWGEVACELDAKNAHLSPSEQAAARQEAHTYWAAAQTRAYEDKRQGFERQKNQAYIDLYGVESTDGRSYSTVLSENAARERAQKDVEAIFASGARPNVFALLEHEIKARNFARAEAVYNVGWEHAGFGRGKEFDALAAKHLPAVRKRMEAQQRLQTIENAERQAATVEGLRSRTTAMRERRFQAPMPDVAGRNLPGRNKPAGR